ncbi:MAG: hypothetical protein ACK2UA_14500 [Anaerolineae bacterium]
MPAPWWHSLLHNQTAWLIKAALLYRRRHLGYQRAIVDVPYHLAREDADAKIHAQVRTGIHGVS